MPKLPPRWRFHHGQHYYQVPPGLEHLWEGRKLYPLGKNLSDAYRKWAERAEINHSSKTIGNLLDRYLLEVIPTKAPKTRIDQTRYITVLRGVLGHLPLLPFPPQWVYKYIDKRPAKVQAKREIEVLSHAYSKAVRWGYIDRHPFKGQVEYDPSKPRTRYVSDDEVKACLEYTGAGNVDSMRAYIKLKLLTGLRRSDLLLITMSDLQDDGIHVTPHKTAGTGKSVIYTWTHELRAAVEEAKTARGVISPFLFCKRNGQGYWREGFGDAPGWNKKWQSFAKRVGVTFTEHDLRAKCASDAETLEHAQAMLAHRSPSTTDRIYRRKPERVKPAK